MPEYNSSNAYKMRSENTSAEKNRKSRPDQQEKKNDQQKHIRPNKTFRLNRATDSKPVLPPRPRVRPFRSFNAGQVRLLFAAGFAFFVLMSFFAFTIGCQVRDNELTSLINERKNTLTELKNDNKGLDMRRNKSSQETNLEEYAEQNLGMKKRENHQIIWFEVDWDNDFDD